MRYTNLLTYLLTKAKIIGLLESNNYVYTTALTEAALASVIEVTCFEIILTTLLTYFVFAEFTLLSAL